MSKRRPIQRLDRKRYPAGGGPKINGLQFPDDCPHGYYPWWKHCKICKKQGFPGRQDECVDITEYHTVMGRNCHFTYIQWEPHDKCCGLGQPYEIEHSAECMWKSNGKA